MRFPLLDTRKQTQPSSKVLLNVRAEIPGQKQERNRECTVGSASQEDKEADCGVRMTNVSHGLWILNSWSPVALLGKDWEVNPCWRSMSLGQAIQSATNLVSPPCTCPAKCTLLSHQAYPQTTQVFCRVNLFLLPAAWFLAARPL